MTALAFKLSIAAVCLAVAEATVFAQEMVNGYTYVAPSYYLSPPLVVAPPAIVVAPQPVLLARPVYAPVTVPPPLFESTTAVPYDPVWPYAYFGTPGPYFRETVRARPREVEYKVKAYDPRGKTVYTYEAETRRHGAVVVRERIR